MKEYGVHKDRNYKSTSESILVLIDCYQRSLKLIEDGEVALGVIKANATSSQNSRYKVWNTLMKDELRYRGLYAYAPEEVKTRLKNGRLVESAEIASSYYQQQGDWEQMWMYLKALDELFFVDRSYNRNKGAVPWLKEDIAAVESYRKALKYETAGEYAAAFKSYNAVLGTSGRFGPFAEAEKALINLKKEHGEEVKEAIENAKAESLEARTRLEAARLAAFSHRNRMNPDGGLDLLDNKTKTQLESLMNKYVKEQLNVYLEKRETKPSLPKESK